MSVVIRLSKTGKKGTRIFRVVAVEKRQKRDSMPLENLGSYTPATKQSQQISAINGERIKYWQSKGALLSAAVTHLLTQKS